MRVIIVALAILVFGRVAGAQCTKEVRRPQKIHEVARLKWAVGGNTWRVVLSWKTLFVSDNGEERAEVTVDIGDGRGISDIKLYDLAPNRCDLPILPQIAAVKLMGRDFLLVTLPDTRGTGGEGLVVSWMYSLDERGKLHQVFHSAYQGHYFRSAACRPFTKSEIRPVDAEGSRMTWIYEYPDVEWVRKKSACATAKRDREEHQWEWKNGCFALVPDQPRKGRLDTDWDDEQCLPGVGLKSKAAPRPSSGRPEPGDGGSAGQPDGGAAP